MSTFLVSFGVIAATIAAVIYVAIRAPEQPPTIRTEPSLGRAKRKDRRPRASRRTAAPVPVRAEAPAVSGPPVAVSPLASVGITAQPAVALPDSDPMALRVLPAKPTTLWVRIRSFVALVMLVAVLGALLALTIGGVLVGGVLLIRSATG